MRPIEPESPAGLAGLAVRVLCSRRFQIHGLKKLYPLPVLTVVTPSLPCPALPCPDLNLNPTEKFLRSCAALYNILNVPLKKCLRPFPTEIEKHFSVKENANVYFTVLEVPKFLTKMAGVKESISECRLRDRFVLDVCGTLSRSDRLRHDATTPQDGGHLISFCNRIQPARALFDELSTPSQCSAN